MAQRTLASPGVQINETDLSLRVDSPTGVGVLVMGFTAQGPTDEIIQVTNIDEFEAVYGKPYTSAERYSYHNIKALFDSPANVYFSRLPYGADSGSIFSNDKYSVLVYPAIPDDGETDYATIKSQGLSAEGADTFYLAKPYHLEIDREQYESLINGETEWKNEFGKTDGVELSSFDHIGNAALVILNKSKSTINEIFEGYYIGVTDNRNTDPGSPFNDVTSIMSINNEESVSDYIKIPNSRLDFSLSASSSSQDSVSEILENIPSFNIGTDEFDDILSIGVFKLRKSPFTNSEIALSFTLSEAFYGSFDNNREIQSSTGGENESLFLERVGDVSNNIQFFVNPHLADAFKLSVSDNSYPKKKIRKLDSAAISSSVLSSDESTLSGDYLEALYPLGIYQQSRGSDKTIGNVVSKIDRVFDLAENPDLLDIDITVEAGLGTIFCATQELSSATYDERVAWDSLSGLEQQTGGILDDSGTVDAYTTIFNVFSNFAEKRRKDHLFIADPIRHIFIRGENTRVLTQTVEVDGKRIPKTFSQHIYWPLRNQFRNANTSYATTYGNWVKVFDVTSNKQVWVPYSGFAASLMANMANIWDAPAGLTRGINTNFNDIAIYPKQKERDQLYKISINPLAFFPNEGFVTWGQKTLLSKPSAFDRIQVRRVFLFLEKATANTSRFFVFEPNNLFTRTSLVNTLTPLFESVKNAGGIVDYLIVASEKNNGPEVVEQNEMRVSIYIKPQKTAEFILVNFFATRQDVSFEELI